MIHIILLLHWSSVMCEKDIIGGFQKTSQYILYHKHIIPPN